MSLKFIRCQENSIESFLCCVKQDGLGRIQTLEESVAKRINSIVVGKIVVVISPYSEVTEQLIFLVKEVLPDGSYGQKFKAVILKKLAVQLSKCSLGTGDRLAFLEPFVFRSSDAEKQNSAKSPKRLKYLLEIGSKQSLLWYSKKQMVLAKNIKTPTNCVNSTEKSKKICEHSEENERIVTKEMERDGKTKDLLASNNSLNSFVRTKPQIQLPLNPQVPTDTRRLNPQYSYRRLAQVQVKASAGDFARVNTFAIVHDVYKPLTKTNNGKYTIICKVVDESIENDLRSFDLHFFISDDTILKHISQGDVLRLHRVKVELFDGKVDGRIFFNHDIVLFKNSFPDTAPITVVKELRVSDEERKRVASLQKWYLEALEQEMRDKTRLGDISKEGSYKIVCKVLEVSSNEGEGTIVVSDGSEISCLSPSLPLHPHTSSCIVTHIKVYLQLEKYLKLQVEDFIYFPDVKAIKTNKLVLMINERVFPLKLDVRTDSVMEIKRRLKTFENTDELTPSLRCDSENLPTRQQVSSDKLDIVSNDEVCHLPTTRKEEFRNKSIAKEKEPDFCPQNKKTSVKEKTPKSGKSPEKETLGDSEIVKDADNLVVKTRKTLFTPNYTDLSDATDETSENLESLTHTKAESGKETVVNPVNNGLSELLKIMKMKYCSPRKLSPEGGRPENSSHNSVDKNKNEKSERSVSEKMLPVVRLSKLTDVDLKMFSEEDGNRNKTVERKGRLRKRTLDESNCAKSIDSLEEASTVVNFSLQKNSLEEPKHIHKRVRLESESTILGVAGHTDSPALIEDVENKCQESRGQKVEKWLLDPNISDPRLQVNQNEELSFEVVKQLLLSQVSASEDLFDCIKNRLRRIKVFLLDVEPDPSDESLNLISGYCYSGCNNLFIFHKIHWVDTDDSWVPHCPDCHELEQVRRLELMLVFQLSVMDLNGNRFPVLVCREQAVSFLKCTAREYLKSPMIRASRCRLLLENTLKAIPRPNPTPLLDLTVAKVENTLCLVSSSLTLPPCP